VDVETKKGALWAPFFFFLALSMLYVTTMPGQHIKGLRGSAAKHGHTVNGKRSPTFCAWDNMVRRCTKPNNSNYGDYGARGVRVADVFLTFDGFLKEVGERPGPGYSLTTGTTNRGTWSGQPRRLSSGTVARITS